MSETYIKGFYIDDDAFPGKSSPACTNNANKLGVEDKIYYENVVETYINERGYLLAYRPYLYHMDESEKLLGEHSAAEYGLPMDVIMILEVKDQPSWIEAAGFKQDEQVTAWLHISSFKNNVKKILETENSIRANQYREIYNSSYVEENDIVHAIEPKAGDVFQLTQFGSDREYDRGNRMWIITNVEDEIISENFNMAFGHYVWKITAKRFRYSYQHGLSKQEELMRGDTLLGKQGEPGNHQVYDNQKELALFDNGDVVEPEKVYEQDLDKESKQAFDMEKNVKGFYNPVEDDGWL